MGHGGRRSRSGRKQGSANQKTREIADAAAKDGITPLEVMLKAMRNHYDLEQWDDAAAIAKDAAPYMHPRLAAVEHSGPGGGPVQFQKIKRVIVDPVHTDS
jgi:hypothetical protein